MFSQTQAFRSWLFKYPSHKYTENTIDRYIRALEKSEEWFSIKLDPHILDIEAISDLEETEKSIKSLPQYETINRSHGHGDFSAALRMYKKFLDAGNNLETPWWPSPEQYSSGITKDHWLQLLNNHDLFNHSSLQSLAQWHELGDAASCVQLSERYGKSIEFYHTSIGVHLARKISEAAECPICNEPNSKYWPNLFVGRKALP